MSTKPVNPLLVAIKARSAAGLWDQTVLTHLIEDLSVHREGGLALGTVFIWTKWENDEEVWLALDDWHRLLIRQDPLETEEQFVARVRRVLEYIRQLQQNDFTYFDLQVDWSFLQKITTATKAQIEVTVQV
jgi:hypothetical protein